MIRVVVIRAAPADHLVQQECYATFNMQVARQPFSIKVAEDNHYNPSERTRSAPNNTLLGMHMYNLPTKYRVLFKAGSWLPSKQ